MKDKEAMLKKLQEEITGELSIGKIFSVLKVGAHVDPNKEQAALARFKQKLVETGVIRKSLDINTEKLQEDIIKRMEAYGWVNETNRKDKLEKLKEKFKQQKYKELLSQFNQVIVQNEEVSV